MNAMLKLFRNKTQMKAGFSLLELSVVLTILSIVVAGGMTLSTTKVEQNQIERTWEEMDELDNAISIFVNENGRLPCPANNALPRTNGAFGRENCTLTTTPATNTLVGGIPFYSLGLQDEYLADDWNSRYSYAVTEALAIDSDPNDGIPAIQPSDTGNITIIDGSGNPITSTAIWTLISHGPTRKGATGAKTINVGTLCDSGNADGENCDFDDATYRDAAFNDGTTASSFFDDYIKWETIDTLYEFVAIDTGVPVCDADDSGGGNVLEYDGSNWNCIDREDHFPLCGNNEVMVKQIDTVPNPDVETWECVNRNNIPIPCADNKILVRESGAWACKDPMDIMPACLVDNQILKRESGAWGCVTDEVATLPTCDAGEFAVSNTDSGTGIAADWSCTPTCATGQILEYNNTTKNWVCIAGIEALPTSCSTNQVLVRSGSSWACGNN